LLFDMLYMLAALVLSPVFIYRILVRGKYRASFWQRWGKVPERPATEPPARRVWIHAVSVGEALSARTLVEMIDGERPDWDVVVSTATETGQAVARKSFGEDRVVYCPFDFSWTVRRAFDRIRPSVLVLLELELWPNLIREAHRRGVPVTVLNGRITERSFRGFRRFRAFFAPTFARVARFAVQTEEYARRLGALGVAADRIAVTGSVKYDAVRTGLDDGAAAEARAELGIADGERVILAGSTHPGEDEALLGAYAALKEDSGPLALVLVPRHPEQYDRVAAAVTGRGLELVRKTELGAGAERPEGAVVLVDTMGELGRLYAAADVVFVGGSLIEHGGQNVMEPAGLGKPCVFGPHMWNFQDAVDALLAGGAAGAARQVASADELAGAVGALLSDANAASEMGEAARRCIEERKGATRRNFEVLTGALEKIAGSSASRPG